MGSFADDVLGIDPGGGGIIGSVDVLGIGAAIEDAFKDITGQTAADEIKAAGKKQLESQSEIIDFLREREETPMAFRDQALGVLGGLLGLPGTGDSGVSRAQFIEGLREDPFYQQSLADAEESILRQQAATGRLRSGSTQAALASVAPQLLENIYSQQVSGLTGLAGMPTNTQSIANVMGQMGETQAASALGAAQARQAGTGQLLGGLTQLGVTAFSDPSLKDDVRVIGEYKGLPWCSWVWNEKAEKLGLSGDGCGFMADDVKKKYPQFVSEVKGHLMVDYGGIYGS